MIYIKRIILGLIGAAVFYGSMFYLSGIADAQPNGFPATPPVTPPNQEGHSTGGVTAEVGNVSLKLNFNAHSGDPVKGNVKYSNSLGDSFSGDVDVCYLQDTDEAVFAGTIGKGTFSEEFFLVEVQDNGEGKNHPADRVRVRVMDTEPDCEMSGVYPAQVTKGNLQVH